jgi:hypothetical protein
VNTLTALDLKARKKIDADCLRGVAHVVNPRDVMVLGDRNEFDASIGCGLEIVVRNLPSLVCALRTNARPARISGRMHL